MIDVNYEAERTLSKLDCEVVYQHPAQFTVFPVVSYYNVADKGAFYADNAESVQSGYVQADVWAKSARSCGELTLRVNSVMTADGWTREMSRDVPDGDGKIFHKTMRFQKFFDLN